MLFLECHSWTKCPGARYYGLSYGKPDGHASPVKAEPKENGGLVMWPSSLQLRVRMHFGINRWLPVATTGKQGYL